MTFVQRLAAWFRSPRHNDDSSKLHLNYPPETRDYVERITKLSTSDACTEWRFVPAADRSDRFTYDLFETSVEECKFMVWRMQITGAGRESISHYDFEVKPGSGRSIWINSRDLGETVFNRLLSRTSAAQSESTLAA